MDIESIISKEGVQPAVRELLVELLAVIESGGEITVTWADVQGKPSSFTPSSHTHSISEMTNLQSELTGIKDRLTALEGGGA